jgi:hypothetical protein
VTVVVLDPDWYAVGEPVSRASFPVSVVVDPNVLTPVAVYVPRPFVPSACTSVVVPSAVSVSV